MKDPCLHCGKVIKCRSHGRGLCCGCFRKPAIRGQYPPLRRTRPEVEPTEAELEATIAEQMRRLPPWWADDCGAGIRVCQLVRCS